MAKRWRLGALKVGWAKVPDVAIAAFVGALVAIILAPISQSLTFYLTQFLSRPVLSIEYVETIPSQRPISFDPTMLQAIVQSPGYLSYVSENPSAQTLILALSGALSSEQAGLVLIQLETIVAGLRRKVDQIADLQKTLERENDPEKTISIIKDHLGPMFNSMAFANDAPEAMKQSFLQHVYADSASASAILQKLEAILKSAQAQMGSGSSIQFKLSILNRGGTDGLIRSTGRIEFTDPNLSVPLLRISPPKSSNPVQNPFAVSVAVTNPPDSIREGSVGKVEKNAMAEFWFAIDEAKLSAAQYEAVRKLLSLMESSKFRIVLSDQERSEISYRSPSR